MGYTDDNLKEGLDDQMRKVYNPAPYIYGQHYFYVLGFTKEKNKKVFWGPFMEIDEAYKALAELNEGEKFELTTKDPHRAVREVRDLLIKRGESPDEALKRLLHKREIEPKKEGIVSKLFAGRLKPKSLPKLTRPPKSIVRIE